MHPNSLKAIEATKWKPGEVPNPTGINQDPRLKKIKKLTTEEVVEVGSFILSNNIVALQKIADDAITNPDSEHSALKVWIARVVVAGAKKGDAKALESVLDRLIGKVAQKMDLSGLGGENGPRIIIELPSNGRELDAGNTTEAAAGTAAPVP